jgi:cellulose synthase/poly-beta-1,6-N-acetylglucosamine synthase-like glycosyltransferase
VNEAAPRTKPVLNTNKGEEVTHYPLVSILIPAKNQERVIERCMQSLKILDYPKDRLEIIVVDGRSRDKTAEIAQRYGAKVVYDDGRGRCRAHGLNAGIADARGEYVAFTDADCSVEPDWLTKALPHFRVSNVGGVGGHTFAPRNAPPIAQAITYLFYCNVSLPKEPASVPYIAGANSVYRAEAIKQPFPIPEVLAGEDAVLNLRVRDLGWKLVFAPEVVVWHSMHYSSLMDLFRHMKLYGKGALQCWRTDKRLVRAPSWLKAFGPPILGFLALALFLIHETAFIAVLGTGVLASVAISALFFRRTHSIRGAMLLPLVAATMVTGYSVGFLKEFAISSVRR